MYPSSFPAQNLPPNTAQTHYPQSRYSGDLYPPTQTFDDKSIATQQVNGNTSYCGYGTPYQSSPPMALQDRTPYPENKSASNQLPASTEGTVTLTNQFGSLNIGRQDTVQQAAGSVQYPPQPGNNTGPPLLPMPIGHTPLVPLANPIAHPNHPGSASSTYYPANASQSSFVGSSVPLPHQMQQPLVPQAGPSFQTGFPPMGMMPPLAGQQQMLSSVPRAPNLSPPGSKTQSARLMADNMPSAVDVIVHDRANRSGVFRTGPTGVAPPLVTTEFTCCDEGNSNPRFIRSSLYAVPTTADLMKSVGLPFVITVQPFAKLHPKDQPVILCDMGPQGPVRCVRCKAYMCPSFTFIDGGRRFQCSLCSATTEVPTEYFAHLDHNGRRVDAFQRPELCLGTYELVATKQYCKNDELPLPPAFIFLLDVSQTAIRSGLVSLFCSRFITEILPSLPRDEQEPEDSPCSISIGFITYDSQLHFYSLVRPDPVTGNYSTCLSKPQMNVVADTEEVFVPSIEGFLVPPDPSLLTNLLSTIPNHFSSSNLVGTSPDPVLGPAVQAGFEALRAAKRCGKLFILHSCLPTAEAPGRLKFREDKHAIGTDREKTLLQPASDFYTKLGRQCVEAGCSVDLFLFPNSFVDVATIAEVPRLTGGNLYKYSCFQADLQGDQFICDLRNAVSQPKAFDAVMRIRTSTGTRPFEFLGNCSLPNTVDVELAAVDDNQTITAEIRHDDKLPDNDMVSIQVAILYTSISGKRRLRVHNLSLCTSSNASHIFSLADLDTYTSWLAKLAVQMSLAKTSAQTAADLTARVAHSLAGYRRLCCNSGAQSASPEELVLPETIKILPIYVQCLIKSDGIRPARNSTIDDRAYMLFLLNSMGPKHSSQYLYPRILPIHQLSPESEDLPLAVRCSYERLQPEAAYFIENGVYAYIWLGLKIDPVWIQQVFGVNDVSTLESERATLFKHDNPTSKRVCSLIQPILASFSHHPRLRVIRQGELSEAWVKRLMYEDRDDGGNPSYVEYLCHIHREVRGMLK